MFNINNRFDFFDEPIDLFKDNEIDFYFERDKREFKTLFKSGFKYLTLNDFNVNNGFKFNNSTNEFYPTIIYSIMEINKPLNCELKIRLFIEKGSSFFIYNDTYTYFGIYDNALLGLSGDGATLYENNNKIGSFTDYGIYKQYNINIISNKISVGIYGENVKFTLGMGTEIPKQTYEIKNYKNSNNKIFNLIKNYKNSNCNNNFCLIRKFKNKKNYFFERISFMQTPPKRIIIRDFNE